MSENVNRVSSPSDQYRLDGWYCYCLCPADDVRGGHYLRLTPEVMDAERYEKPLTPPIDYVGFAHLCTTARKAGWSGEGQWYVISIPNWFGDGYSKHAFMVRATNNGESWVFSQLPMYDIEYGLGLAHGPYRSDDTDRIQRGFKVVAPQDDPEVNPPAPSKAQQAQVARSRALRFYLDLVDSYPGKSDEDILSLIAKKTDTPPSLQTLHAYRTGLTYGGRGKRVVDAWKATRQQPLIGVPRSRRTPRRFKDNRSQSNQDTQWKPGQSPRPKTNKKVRLNEANRRFIDQHPEIPATEIAPMVGCYVETVRKYRRGQTYGGEGLAPYQSYVNGGK